MRLVYDLRTVESRNRIFGRVRLGVAGAAVGRPVGPVGPGHAVPAGPRTHQESRTRNGTEL